MSGTHTPSADRTFSFGSFLFDSTRQVLLDDHKPVRVGSRALAILGLLLERAGDVVSKDELSARVWPDTVVEDGSIRVHIAALRRALGDRIGAARFISNVSGRGYRFVATVSVDLASSEPSTPLSHVPSTSDLPAAMKGVFGRDEIVDAIASSVQRNRLVTIVGAGGIGKTTVAISVADAVMSTYRDGVRFVSFASISDSRMVPTVLGSVLGLGIRPECPLADVVAFLRERQMLLVFDNCEHVIEAVAPVALELRRNTDRTHILATSREPLRVDDEVVHRLPPLTVPPPGDSLSAADALYYSAVQLFVERASACSDSFEFRDEDAPIVAEICRRLEGVPLAIELAAAQVVAFGVSGLATVLRDRFALVMRGSRTALPRQQTLHQTLDWSFELLSPIEKAIFRRLAILMGAFNLEAACAISSNDEIPRSSVLDSIANLVEKSLLVANVEGQKPQYRLLELTRVYGRERLIEGGEHNVIARRHARYYEKLLKESQSDWLSRRAVELQAEYGYQIDDIRAALDWAFSPDGDDDTGIALTIASVPMWMHFWLVEECREHVERALARLEAKPDRNERQKLLLLEALGYGSLHTTGLGPETDDAWKRAAEIAENLHDAEHRLITLWGSWVGRHMAGDFRGALAIARKFANIDSDFGDLPDKSVGQRLLGVSLHIAGEQVAARRQLEQMLESYVAPPNRAHLIRFQFDQTVVANTFYSQILWVLGFPDKATRISERSVMDAQAIDHAPSLYYTLEHGACPVALLTGDFSRLNDYISIMLEALPRYRPATVWSECFRGAGLIETGHHRQGVEILRHGLEGFHPSGFQQRYTQLLAELARGWRCLGEFNKALTAVEQAFVYADRTGERWYAPELLRVKAEILAQSDRQHDRAAEELFRMSLDSARKQSALSWELRTATSLAQLWLRQDRSAEARALLDAVYRQFTEGFDTADLIAAGNLLDRLQ